MRHLPPSLPHLTCFAATLLVACATPVEGRIGDGARVPAPEIAPPPNAELDLESHDRSEVETIRKAHIKHEAAVRSVGMLYYLAAAACAMGAAGTTMFAVVSFETGWQNASVMVGALVLYALLAFAFGAVGRGLRTLRQWVRIPVGILSGLGLLGFEATFNRDYPVIFGTMYFFSLLGLMMTLIGDIMYTIIDPRIDFEARNQ